MTIELGEERYEMSHFVFKEVTSGDFDATLECASRFLTQWISGSKVFEVETSGTTGPSKTIQLKRKWMEISALQTISILELYNENCFCCIPINKIGGLMMIVRALAGGFNIKIVEPTSDPMVVLSPTHTFTLVSLVPYQLIKILQNPESREKLNRFKIILLGGSDIRASLLNEIQNLKPSVYHTFGMTETCSHIALKKLNNGAWQHFKPNPDISIVTNESGLMSVKGFQTGSEWVHTSDIIKLNEDGTFDFIGRSDFAINSGGYKIHPEQVEQKLNVWLNQHYDIHANYLVTSLKDELLGEKCILVGNKHLPELWDTLIYMWREILEPYQIPKQFFKIEQLPINAGGKVDRKKLQEMVAAIG